MPEPLRAPFPYFGGKSKIAPIIWDAFGDVANYVEPFAGSLAVLLSRPTTPGIETVNDLDGLISNFWRSIKFDPEAVAWWADFPVSETDLHARHAWLVNRRERLTWSLDDPDFYDAKIAGWWCWGICSWIGGGWCSGKGPWVSNGAHIQDSRDNARLGNGPGINRKRPHLNAGQGIYRQRPHLNAGQGINRQRTESLNCYFGKLADRLQNVRVCCGDWSRVIGPTPTTKQGMTAVFLDPPYADTANRNEGLYAMDSMSVAHDVREWAIANGDNPLLRIALCGYDIEHEMPATWRVHEWNAGMGYGSQRRNGKRGNGKRERVWFSSHCLGNAAPKFAFENVAVTA